MDKIIYKKEIIKNTINVRITHPEFGYVDFNSISPRQADILGAYNLLIIKKKQNENKRKLKKTTLQVRRNLL